MKTYKLILGVLLKNNFKSNKNGMRKDDGTLNIGMTIGFGFGILMIIAVLAVAGFFAGASAKVSDAGVEVLTSLVVATQFVTLFFGATTIFSTMFMSDDNEFLLSLPIPSSSVFAAKLTIVYINELAITAVCLVPTLIAFGVGMGVSGGMAALYFVLIPIMVLSAPVLPLVLVSVLAVPLMYLIAFFKKRAMLTTIVVAVLAVAAFAVYMASFANMGSSFGEGAGVEISEGFKNALAVISYIFYPNRAIASVALGLKAGMNAGIFIGSLALMALIVWFVTAKLFKKGMAAQLESQQTQSKNKEIILRQNSGVKALLIRDAKMLLRNPGFAINSFLGLIVAPAITLIMGFSMGSAMSSAGDAGLGGNENLLNVGLSMMYFLMLGCGMNYVAGLSFTREGKTFYILKYLPIDKKLIIKSKMYFADISSFVSAVLMVIASAIVFKLDILNIILMLVVCVLYAKGFNYWLIYRDMRRPNLTWNNVNEAVKRNYYIVIPMFGGMAVGVVSIVVSTVLMTFGGVLGETVQYVIFWMSLLAIAIAVTVLFGAKLKNKSEELFYKIGENENTFKQNDKKSSMFGKGNKNGGGGKDGAFLG